MFNVGEAADYLGLKAPTLRKWAVLRKGPVAVKVGSAVRYRQADLDAWLDSRPRVGGEEAGA